MTDWKQITEEEEALLKYTWKGSRGNTWRNICDATLAGPVFIASKEGQELRPLLQQASTAAIRYVGKGVIECRSLADGSGIVLKRKAQP